MKKNEMSPREVRDLITIYASRKTQEQSKNLWKDMEKEMKEKGYNSSCKIYRSKWNSLRSTYERKKKESKFAKWQYFKVMDDIFGSNEQSNDSKQLKLSDCFKSTTEEAGSKKKISKQMKLTDCFKTVAKPRPDSVAESCKKD